MPIPGQTFQTSYILTIIKTIKQQNPKLKKILSININIINTNTLNLEHTTKSAQNVHCELWHKQRDGDATD